MHVRGQTVPQNESTSQATLYDTWQKLSEKRRKASTDTTSFESESTVGDLADVSKGDE